MKKIIYTAAAIALGFFGARADELKMDARSSQIAYCYEQLVKNPGNKITVPADAPFEADGFSRSTSLAGCIVTLADDATAADVEKYGLTVTADFDDVVVAEGPIDAIIALAKSDYVKIVDFAQKLEPQTNVAREATRQNMVLAGTELPQKYDGTGVICGIYDTGIDPNHVNFYNTAFTGSRVKVIWRATGSGGTGTSYETPERIASFTTDDQNATHGTHTLGCMTGAYSKAGNGTGVTSPSGWCTAQTASGTVNKLGSRANLYYGMATGADIYVGCGQLYDTNWLTAIRNICEYAEKNNQPAVINLSIGHTRGSHDGTDATSRTLAQLGKRALIFVAAGNDGDTDLSIVKKLTATDKTVKTTLVSARNYSISMDIYSSSDKQFTVKPVIYDTIENKIVYTAPSFTGVGTYVLAAKNMTTAGYKHAAEFDDAFTNNSVVMLTGSDNAGTSNRYNVSANITINYNTATNAKRNKVLGFVIEGADGQRIDMIKATGNYTVNFSGNGQPGWSDGTPELSISGMACGENIVVVGAWTTRNTWPATTPQGNGMIGYRDTEGLEEGEVSGFSSYGELADGRKLPDIVAPGAAIIASISSYYTKNSAQPDYSSACYKWNDRYYHFDAEQGTSMATPITAGIVATWLQAKPDLTITEAREILKSTAIKDGYVTGGLYPEIKWGAGKVDAYAGLKKILDLDGVKDIVADSDDIFVVNKGGNQYELHVAGAKAINATVYNMSGVAVGHANQEGDTVIFDGSSLSKGIYIVNVNGLQSSRIVIR